MNKERKNTMTVLVVEAMRHPYIKEITSGLLSLQQEVGGNIEIIYPFEDLVGIVLNEEGKYRGLPLNRGLYDREGELYDIIAGTFLVVGLSEENLTSLTKEQIEKFMGYYKEPEVFMKHDNKIFSLPVVLLDSSEEMKKEVQVRKKDEQER